MQSARRYKGRRRGCKSSSEYSEYDMRATFRAICNIRDMQIPILMPEQSARTTIALERLFDVDAAAKALSLPEWQPNRV